MFSSSHFPLIADLHERPLSWWQFCASMDIGHLFNVHHEESTLILSCGHYQIWISSEFSSNHNLVCVCTITFVLFIIRCVQIAHCLSSYTTLLFFLPLMLECRNMTYMEGSSVRDGFNWILCLWEKICAMSIVVSLSFFIH